MVFLLPAVACLVVAGFALGDQGDPGAGLSLVGALAYLGGGVVLTVAYHVPRNNRLDRLTPTDPAAAEVWGRYLSEWSGMNHVRTAASVVSAVTLYLGTS